MIFRFYWFWVTLHLCSSPFIQTLKSDEMRQELEPREAGEGHISCPSGEASWGWGSPRQWFLASVSP